MELILKPRSGWRSLDIKELWQRRELMYFLVWRDIKIRYRQTAFGVAWAVLQPLVGMVVFTLLFHRVAGIETGTDTPYELFAYSGLLAWTFFSSSVSQSTNSLISSQDLIKKIYFPRPFIPIGSTGALLLDLLIGIGLGFGLLFWFDWPVSAKIVFLPLFILGSFMAACGIGLILSAMSVRYRDIKYIVPFFIQMGLFVTPVIYPARLVEKFPLIHEYLGLNPMAGMVHGFRVSLLGDAPDWRLIGMSFSVSIVLFVAGLFIFRRWERHFADII
jgi:lipopolysaccharide transport system permease protein